MKITLSHLSQGFSLEIDQEEGGPFKVTLRHGGLLVSEAVGKDLERVMCLIAHDLRAVQETLTRLPLSALKEILS